MKLKKQVKFDKQTMTVTFDKYQKTINPEDYFIIRALQNRVTDDAHLLKLVMTTEQIDEIEAGFRMAGFVEEYGEFLEEEPIGIMPYHND
ncbi:MAG: hypothetical protein V3G42_11105 [Oscillospiraceae bacterium]